jgi:hypothetical protein
VLHDFGCLLVLLGLESCVFLTTGTALLDTAESNETSGENDGTANGGGDDDLGFGRHGCEYVHAVGLGGLLVNGRSLVLTVTFVSWVTN